MKRKMTPDEKMLVEAILSHGCVICGQPAQFHHIKNARPNALACGFGLCVEHHTGEAYPGQSIHSSKLLFEGKHGTELELFQAVLFKVFNRSVPF
ncbi:MAG: hypothetical protein PHW65_05920 [Dehalococcoidales bacterium]|jgi:hypothetical protein|nr:hypothetical protein [Dehalococcoidales bacterium]